MPHGTQTARLETVTIHPAQASGATRRCVGASNSTSVGVCTSSLGTYFQSSSSQRTGLIYSAVRPDVRLSRSEAREPA